MSSSSDLEAGIAQEVARKKTKRAEKKSKPKPGPVVAPAPIAAPEHGKNEGDDPHWAYEPPEGAVLFDHTVDVGPFEWNAVKEDEDVEIWLIRVPDTIKAKHLEGLEIDPPSSSRTARIGSLIRKTASYDVWSVGDDDTDVAGAEELRGLSCLLPRKRKKGKLYVAPRQVSHRIVISAKTPIATAPEGQPIVYQNPPRPSYPKEVLKYAFVPYGARLEQNRSEDAPMDADDGKTTRVKPASDAALLSKDKPAKTIKFKGKKRKGEGDSPKKSKKHKPDA